MANLLLGVTGSVAAIYTPALFESLKQAGHKVKVVATAAASYFFDPAALDPLSHPPRRNPQVVILDEDEWPGREEGRHYQRSDQVLHIELRRWASGLIIAPLDANTLAKLVHGLCDNCLSCVWRAWDRANPVVLAPAMNTLMWENPATLRHLRLLAGEGQAEMVPADLEPAALLDWINSRCPRLRVLQPQSKRLACDDIGVGAMASHETVLAAVASLVR